VRQRRTFWGRAVSEGLRWARGVLHEVVLLLGLVLLTAGVTVGGVLLHRPGWFLGVFGGVLLLVVLGEGAYRAYESKARAVSPTGSSTTAADRLEGFAREFDLLRREIPEPFSEAHMEDVNWSYNDLVARVNSELRRNAPEYLDEWKTQPPGVPYPVPLNHSAATDRLYEFSAEQLQAIAEKWRGSQ
jgi:hypothetical protein